MLGILPVKSRSKDEGEKPFWISYADLMTALMVLFLVVMVASLLMVTQKIAIETQGEKDRASDIKSLCESLQLKAKLANSAINVDCAENRINFGEAGRFGHDDYRLGQEGVSALRAVVPLVLDAAESPEGKKWFKQILIEGFTDTDGSYLYNLHLSLQRSEWVMCSLLDQRYSAAMELDARQQKLVRELFLAGGVSFNNAKESKEASRRVELRMQFYGLKEQSGKNEASPEFHITKPELCKLS
ncbi:type I Zorya anti-phage system protein ZorB1 [Vogesella indigofera]|uniref:type I Zorya anti-phage system protein ZorB1 n=1 Tax=Vogesella indigofera TaxID=45465 RepID=UPI00234EED24|nr:type I Zorya anti-phage system protein ZorB1 [Vogesella indigofera]MDC7698327.1 flagellar motor protein MotB [Vogesella indigofera]